MKIDSQKFIIAMAREQVDTKTLSLLSKVGKTTISGIKTGKTTNIEPKTFGKLCKALKTNVNDLLSTD